MNEDIFDAAVREVHLIPKEMLSEDYPTSDGAAEATLRCNKALAAYSMDRRLSFWIESKLETDRAQTCHDDLIEMQAQLTDVPLYDVLSDVGDKTMK